MVWGTCVGTLCGVGTCVGALWCGVHILWCGHMYWYCGVFTFAAGLLWPYPYPCSMRHNGDLILAVTFNVFWGMQEWRGLLDAAAFMDRCSSCYVYGCHHHK